MRTVAVLNGIETVIPTFLYLISESKPFRASGPAESSLDFAYVVDGCLWLDAPEGPSPVSAGDVCIRGPHQTAEVFTEGPIVVYHFYFACSGGQIDVLQDDLRTWAHTILYAPDPAPFARTLLLPDVLHLSQPAQKEELLAQIIRKQASAGVGSALAVQADFLHVLHLITEDVIALLTQDASTESGLATNQHIRRAVECIEIHLSSPLTPRQVAEHLDLNVDYLGRLFQHFLGESIGAFIMRRRLTQARRLLASTKMSVKQVAHQVGYADPLYFTRIFHREEGCTPREYQRAHRDALLPTGR